MCSLRSLRLLRFGSGHPGSALGIRVSDFNSSSPRFDSEDKYYQIDDEEQHNGHFENEHPTIRLVMIEQLVQVVEGLQLAVNGSMPIRQMETRRNIFVNPSQIPIPQQFGAVANLFPHSPPI